MVINDEGNGRDHSLHHFNNPWYSDVIAHVVYESFIHIINIGST